MRRTLGALYWAISGALFGFGLVAMFTIGAPFVLAGMLMAFIGGWRPGFSGAWAFLVGFGSVPAALLSGSFLGQVAESDWSCSRISFTANESYGYGSVSPDGEVASVTCSTIPGQILVVALVFLALALAGVALGFLAWRRPRAAGG